MKHSELDFGIRLVVIMMEELGFIISDSGDGGPEDECVMPFPHVVLVGTQESPEHTLTTIAADYLKTRLSELGIQVTKPGEPGPSIQYSYWPVEEYGQIVLMGLSDKDLPLDVQTMLDDIYIDLVSKEK